MAQNWFKHDYAARNDEKILELRAEYGWEGYGLFFGLIESMCETETGCIDVERIGGLSVGYGVAKEWLLAFIRFCVEIELFYEDEDGLIKSDRVISHLDHMNTLKEAGKKGAKKRWKDRKNRVANGGAIADPNADKIRLDKKREEKNIPTLDEVQDYFKEKGFGIELANRFYQYYNEPMVDNNGRVWKDQSGKAVKSWKQKALAVWMKEDNKKEMKVFDGGKW